MKPQISYSMNYDPISYLGLSCPFGGSFYVCQGSKIEFLGCCDVDPCSSECPSSALHPASFNTSRYHEISAQSCVGSASPSLWYTCINGPGFLGCCASNPCDNEGVCREDDLLGARLADDPKSASVFLTATTAATVTSAASTSTPTDGSTSASTSTAITTTQIPSPTPTIASKGNSPAPTAGIVGGILGGLVILMLFAFVFFQYRRRIIKELATAQSDEDTLRPPWSPYHDSFRSSPTMPPAPVSPLSMASRHHKSLSASLSSLIGFKHGSAAKRQNFRKSDWIPGTHDSRQVSPGFLDPVAELDSLPSGGLMVQGPLHNTVHYEVEGSKVGVGSG
ncbi:hypothetical protein F4782DRAFT_104127 [Xylaria castorea]|nr:hypothetical protein F4782DRAFT_104127 [Xylaria castorea]